MSAARSPTGLEAQLRCGYSKLVGVRSRGKHAPLGEIHIPTACSSPAPPPTGPRAAPPHDATYPTGGDEFGFGPRAAADQPRSRATPESRQRRRRRSHVAVARPLRGVDGAGDAADALAGVIRRIGQSSHLCRPQISPPRKPQAGTEGPTPVPSRYSRESPPRPT